MIRSALALLGVLAPLGACSTFDPSVGPLRSDVAATSTCNLGSSGYGTSYGSPSGASAEHDFCTADGGSLEGACDECEAAHCCAQRVACYTDKGCSCADSELDPCRSDVPEASATSALKACWSTFAASSPIATARYQCLRTSCAAECGIPN